MKARTCPTAVPVLRLGHLNSFTSHLRDIGQPIDCQLRREGLPVLCDDADHVVPLRRAWSFFDYSAQKVDPMVGWRVGASAGEHNLNDVLRRTLESAPTLLQALRGLARKARSEASHIQLGIWRRGHDALIYSHYTGMGDVPGYLVAQGYQLGTILGLIRCYLGRSWLPNEIGTEGSVPPYGLDDYFAGTRIMLGRRFGYLAVPMGLLNSKAIDLGDDIDSSGYGAADAPGFADTLRALLPGYLADGYPTATFAARLMDVSERTLARRLAAEHLTFGQLIDEVRFAEASRLLADPVVRVEDVAKAVGFNDQSNFSRMFRRIAGVTPVEYRT